MAVGKEIRTKIKSVQNTQKITRAMQMVATSKMRKTQDRMRAARPYAEKVRQVMAHLAQTNPDAENALLTKRDSVKRVGVILITSDKGLAGGLNANLVYKWIRQQREPLPTMPAFVPVPLNLTPSERVGIEVLTIQIDIPHRAGSLSVRWPAQDAVSCARFLRGLLA